MCIVSDWTKRIRKPAKLRNRKYVEKGRRIIWNIAEDRRTYRSIPKASVEPPDDKERIHLEWLGSSNAAMYPPLTW